MLTTFLPRRRNPFRKANPKDADTSRGIMSLLLGACVDPKSILFVGSRFRETLDGD